MTTSIYQDKVSLIKSHLFSDLSILKSIKTKRRNYIGKHMSVDVFDDNEELSYIDVKIENRIDSLKCFLKKNMIAIPKNYKKPIMIGLDTSYGYQNYIRKGNACYGWGTVLTSMVDGNVSEEIMAEVRKMNRYVIMLSDKVFDQNGENRCVVPHHILQKEMFNMLKVVSEGKMISEPLFKITNTLSSYGYNYKFDNPKRTIIIKDGPLVGGFFKPFGNALLSEKIPERLKDEYKIYKTVALAGLKGIPIIGLTKHPSYSVLAKHYNEPDVLDYSIIKQIAKEDTYFYLGPFERKHKKNKNFRIYYYYLYFEDRFNPMRLELIPDLLPQDLNPDKLVEDMLMALKVSDSGEISNYGEEYKLPTCIATADQTTREIVKEKSAKLYEALEKVRRKIPGSILDRRR